MAQLNWQYYSLSGQAYSIDIYHGDKSRHLIVFINSEIVLVEFDQKESKKFNFYIENQLIELALKETDAEFNYVVTPQIIEHEIVKEKTFDHHFWIPLILIIIIINLLFILLL